MMKSAALVPLSFTLLIVIATEAPFVSVTDFDAPTPPPTGTLAQLRLDGLAVAAARHFDPEIEHRTRSVTSINDLRIKVFAEEAAGTRNNCVIRHFMGGSFFTKNERQHFRPNCECGAVIPDTSVWKHAGQRGLRETPRLKRSWISSGEPIIQGEPTLSPLTPTIGSLLCPSILARGVRNVERQPCNCRPVWATHRLPCKALSTEKREFAVRARESAWKWVAIATSSIRRSTWLRRKTHSSTISRRWSIFRRSI